MLVALNSQKEEEVGLSVFNFQQKQLFSQFGIGSIAPFLTRVSLNSKAN